MKLKKTVINGQTVYVEVAEGEKDEDAVEFIKVPQVDMSQMHHFAKSFRHFSHHHEEHKDDDEKDEEKDASKKKYSSKTEKLMRMLPFLEEEDVHALLEKVLADDASVQGLDLEAILPFLEEEDCDRLFLRFLETGEEVTMGMIPFVSEECLDKVVDSYIEGKQPHLDIDNLYPFLDSKTLKKLLQFELSKN